jgi:hypothetical protein
MLNFLKKSKSFWILSLTNIFGISKENLMSIFLVRFVYEYLDFRLNELNSAAKAENVEIEIMGEFTKEVN